MQNQYRPASVPSRCGVMHTSHFFRPDLEQIEQPSFGYERWWLFSFLCFLDRNLVQGFLLG